MRAWDIDWGDGTARSSSRTATRIVSESSIHERRVARSPPKARSRSAIRAATAAKRSTRSSGSRGARSSISGTRSSSTTIPSTALSPASIHLYGKYQTPFGFGRLTIDDGVAYGEPFDTATAALRFEGSGVRLDALEIHKSTGRVTGAAWVGWDGNYSFDADGAKIPVESLKTLAVPAGAAVGHAAVHRDRQRHVRGAALRRAACAWTTCSPATKASAS